MRSKLLLILLAVVALVGCGKAVTTTKPSLPATPPSVCNPVAGQGTMGVCTPPAAAGTRFSTPPLQKGAILIPDVSEFQGCALHSAAIFRVFEAGTGREDASARCHARAVQALHVWYAVYAFLRPAHGGCVGQALRTIAIVRGLGGVVGPVIADAEVWLPPGFVTCFVRTLQSHGYVAVIYTSPGTWPGGAFAVGVWVAAYPYRPACFSNACPYLAHQFSSAFNCRGVFGDCSVNEGILSVRQRPVCRVACKTRRRGELLRLRAELRRDLTRRRCRVAPYHGRGRYHRVCMHWLAYGARVNRELRSL
jgi:hypothetical protein